MHLTHAFQDAPARPPVQDAGRIRAEQVLSALPNPLLVLLRDRRLLFANTSAERMIAEHLGQARADHLMSLGQLGAAQLGDVLSQAAQGTSSRHGLWFTPSLDTGWLHAAPLAPAIALACDWPQHSVLLAVHLDQPALTQAARIDALTRQCRLSQAERHVLLLLADGEPVEATSRHLGLCVSTVRSHVRSLLGKTQAPNLMQLLRWTGSAQALPH